MKLAKAREVLGDIIRNQHSAVVTDECDALMLALAGLTAIEGYRATFDIKLLRQLPGETPVGDSPLV